MIKFDKQKYIENDARAKEETIKILESLGIHKITKENQNDGQLKYHIHKERTEEQVKKDREMGKIKKPDIAITLDGNKTEFAIEVQVRNIWKRIEQFYEDQKEVCSYPLRRNAYRQHDYWTMIITYQDDMKNSYAYWLQNIDAAKQYSKATDRSDNECFVIFKHTECELNWKNLDFLMSHK